MTISNIRYLISSVFCLLLACSFVVCQASQLPTNLQGEPDTAYRVDTIYQESNIYVIELSRNDSIFKVLSTNSLVLPSKLRREKLSVGQSYAMQLDLCFPFDLQALPAEVSGFFFGGTIIYVKMGDVYYTVPNLLGLYLYE